MKIVLNGGGDEKVAYDSHRFFSESIRGQRKVLYIPIAILGANSKYTPEGCFNWFQRAFEDFPFAHVDMITTFGTTDYSMLETYDGIYIGGGNTYGLLKDLKETGFYRLLKSYMVKTDGIIYGGSAGAAIFGKTIDTCRYADPNDVRLEDTDGFDVIGGYSLWCHYKSKDDDQINELLNEGIKVIALAEDSSLYIHGDVLMNIHDGVYIVTREGKMVQDSHLVSELP